MVVGPGWAAVSILGTVTVIMEDSEDFELASHECVDVNHTPSRWIAAHRAQPAER